MATDPMRLPWRTGAYPYRSIYAVPGRKAPNILIGSMQTAVLAKQLVAAHNAALAAGGGFSSTGSTGGF